MAVQSITVTPVSPPILNVGDLIQFTYRTSNANDKAQIFSFLIKIT